MRDLFTAESAEAILRELRSLPWGVVFNEGEQVIELDAERVARLTQEDAERLRSGILEGARNGYQFLYGHYPLGRAYFTHERPPTPLFAVYEFINSATFLDIVRTLTGVPTIRWADAQATKFGAGHFLMGHTDVLPEHHRVAAYVLNFTKHWNLNWGGYLQFFNELDDIEEAWRPVFNAMNIFRIPVGHSVSPVTSFALAQRFSITGWFREDEPPGDFGG